MLVNNDFSEAETFLQMSARWCSHHDAATHESHMISMTTLNMISLNNLGTLHWLYGIDINNNSSNNSSNNDSNKNDNSTIFQPQKIQQNFHELNLIDKTTHTTPTTTTTNNNNTNTATTNNNNNNISNNTLSQNDEKRILLALEYWNEALVSVVEKSIKLKVDTQSKTMASAACMTPASVSTTAPTTTPANNNNTNANTTPATTATAMTMNQKLLQLECPNLLQDIKFSISYATLLCNIAEAYMILHKKEEASQYLIAALHLLETHSVEHSYIISPYLGRVLGLIAYQHMQGSQAVTAEGLFRSAIEKFKNTDVLKDPRCVY